MISTFKTADNATMKQLQEEMTVRKTTEVFLLFAMGSQFDHLIKQMLEQLGVFCLVADPHSVKVADVHKLSPQGIIISGGPGSVHAEEIVFHREILDLGIPVLGICLGFQLWAQHVGATVEAADKREFGVHTARRTDLDSDFLKLIPTKFNVLESHGDRILSHPEIVRHASTKHAYYAAGSHKHLYGVQFHPEVTDTEYGREIFANFCFDICEAQDRFPADGVADKKVYELREKIGDEKVLLALSGGSDSATVAYLLREALKDKPRRIRGVYIRGIDRPDDQAFVEHFFGNEDWLELKIVDATSDFLRCLAGAVSMREKRIAMRGVYKSILEAEARKYDASFIAQGTLYTDISESGGGYDAGSRKAQIKLHHNIDLGFSLPELTPLDDCVKDGGRHIGRSLGVPEELLVRHPFPGPGLVVRIEGEVDATNLAVARKIDDIYIEELRKWDLYKNVWQAGAVVTRSEVTCTKGDDAATGLVIALWAVWSVNGFTARAAELPWDFIRHVSQRITNEVHEAGTVVYRVSDKPPSTIEWG